MDDTNFQNSLYITSMKQKLSGPIEAHGPFIHIYMIFSSWDHELKLYLFSNVIVTVLGIRHVCIIISFVHLDRCIEIYFDIIS